MARARNVKNNPHYVNNKELSMAVYKYAESVKKAKDEGETIPVVPDYIGRCFLRMAEGLSHRSNFVRYTYREEMVMDAVENCLKAVANYNVNATTEKGLPNAFGYFTQISWFAFLRRIAKEKKQQDVKMKFIAEAGLDEFMVSANEDPETAAAISSFVEHLRERITEVKDKDDKLNTYKRKQRLTNRKDKSLDSDLSEMFDL